MTLTEILTVVALMGLLGVGALKYDFQNSGEAEKMDRLTVRTTAAFRHAKTAAVSGRTNVAGGCSDYAILVGENALTGSMVQFDGTSSVTSSCGTDPDATIPAPVLGDAKYKFMAVTAYDKDGNVAYRIANAADYGGTTGTSGIGVAVFVKGSTLKAFPATCGTVSNACVDFTNKSAVQLKINLSYRQNYGARTKSSSKDLWIDLRTGNMRVKDPV